MKLHNPTADIFIPDARPVPDALARVTHLAVGAHQDDLEFMAFHGILQCFHSPDQWFAGVTCTNGAGSSRTGNYAPFTDEEMMAVRRDEQKQAAIVGRYSAILQLDYPSRIAKDPTDTRLRQDLHTILQATHPSVVYTHNPADKHDTHIAVLIPLLQAIRDLPAAQRPQAIHGCEVWRNLDWLNDDEKIIHDLSGHDNLAAALNGIFDSQIAGGKRYDLAVMGRRLANATFYSSHNTDTSNALAYAMDLTPLAQNDTLDIIDYVTSAIDRFRADVEAKLRARLGK